MKIPAQCEMVVTLRREGVQGGGIPDFIIAGHRHLEKEKPASLDGPSNLVRGTVYRMPVDLVRLVVSPAEQLDAVDTIEEVLLGYKTK